MNLRAIILRVMLGALGLAALFGVTAIFTDGLIPAGRLLGTSITIAVGSGMLLPVSANNAARRFSPLAMVWTGYVGIGALLVIGAIWYRGPVGLGWGMELPAGSWIGYGLGAMIVAVGPLTRRNVAMDRTYRLAESIAMWGAGISFGTSFMMQMAFGTGMGGEFALASYFILLGTTVVAAICAMGLRAAPQKPGRDRETPGPADRALSATGLGASGVASILWLWYAFEEIRPFGSGGDTTLLLPDRLHVAAATATSTLALCSGLWLMLSAFPLKGATRLLRYVVVACTACAGAIVTAEFMDVMWSDWRDLMLERVLAALLVVDACAILAAVVVLRISKASGPASDRARPVATARLTCPRCQRPHIATRGESACSECGLVFLLEFRDDRCPACTYDLRALPPGSPCPECGRERQVPGLVPASDA
jgi:hypothetical protein